MRYGTADLQARIRLVESGNAVAILPDLIRAGRAPSCRLIDLPGRPRRTLFTAQRAAGERSPATAVFLDTLERAANTRRRRGRALTGPRHRHLTPPPAL
ncbi:LysR substrate-binding domain-containing protein [Leifsonia sp. McL0607]|uniref:LysR substrate-binding domain-containing protein n=1 Tax=Leifsonia sp. McL0607 TaxID=3415672 RepID=UPI003CF3D161